MSGEYPSGEPPEAPKDPEIIILDNLPNDASPESFPEGVAKYGPIKSRLPGPVDVAGMVAAHQTERYLQGVVEIDKLTGESTTPEPKEGDRE